MQKKTYTQRTQNPKKGNNNAKKKLTERKMRKRKITKENKNDANVYTYVYIYSRALTQDKERQFNAFCLYYSSPVNITHRCMRFTFITTKKRNTTE